jgi:hypothetical protein
MAPVSAMPNRYAVADLTISSYRFRRSAQGHYRGRVVPAIFSPLGQPGSATVPAGQTARRQGHDFDFCRQALRRRGITPRIARRGIESSERLGRFRWIVERTNAWVLAYRRLMVRVDR